MQDKISQVYIPEEKVDSKDGKKDVSKKRFPGYILVEMDLDEDSWGVVKSINGVTNFVGAYGSAKPRPLSQNEVASLFDNEGEQKGKDKVGFAVEFSVGEHVKVTDGPFNNFSGVVEEVSPEKGRLRVKVEIFGRATPVELDFSQVGKL